MLDRTAFDLIPSTLSKSATIFFPLRLLADKVELASNGLDGSRGVVARQTPPPPSSPSGQSPAVNSSGSSPSPGQDAVGPAAPAEPSPNAPSSAEQANSNTTESTTDSLPAG